MKIITKLLSSLFLFFERIKGTSKLVEIKETGQGTNGHMIGKSFAGYEINIYCHCRHLRRVYSKFYVPDRHFILYRVISVVSKDAPVEIQRACELDTIIPNQLPMFVDSDTQKKAAISAYLDLVIARILYFKT